MKDDQYLISLLAKPTLICSFLLLNQFVNILDSFMKSRVGKVGPGVKIVRFNHGGRVNIKFQKGTF